MMLALVDFIKDITQRGIPVHPLSKDRQKLAALKSGKVSSANNDGAGKSPSRIQMSEDEKQTLWCGMLGSLAQY